MPRPKLHRAICDCLDCTVEPKVVSDLSLAARQEPPPKCLVIYTNPAWPLGQDETASTPKSALENGPHLESLAKAGSCGLIYYREAPQGILPGLKGLPSTLSRNEDITPSWHSRWKPNKLVSAPKPGMYMHDRSWTLRRVQNAHGLLVAAFL